MSSPPNLPNLPTEVLRAILKEAFAGSEIRISLCHKNDPALINESVLEYFGTFVQLVDPESLALTPLVNFKRRPQASSHGNVFVASAVNNYFGPLIACRQLYQESFPIFWQSTKFVLEEGITSDDLVAWIPALWNSHIARVQTEGISHVLAKELKGTRGFERLEQLRICDYGDAQPPPVIHEISDQTDQKADEMILLCRVSCWRDMSFPMRTMAKLAALVPSLNIVISFPVAVYYSNDAVATWMDSSKTFAGWLPDVVSSLLPARNNRQSC